ncbi:MAG: DOMON domain-containing protein [Negativicutes bacterium]|nr:DOMON domain-containing protein [Negativicutes bacterium]
MKNCNRIAGLTLVLVLSLIVLGCAGSAATPPPAAPPAPQASAKEPGVSSSPAQWQSDGIIADKEYTSHQKIGDIDVYSRVSGDTVLFGLRAETQGYLAIGIGAEDKMKGADILMGFIKDGQATVSEVHSTGPYGPHPAVQASTVGQVSGSLKDGVMTIEFSRKLDPGGADTKPLKIGENQLIWALGPGMDIEKKHGRRGSGTITLVQ